MDNKQYSLLLKWLRILLKWLRIFVPGPGINLKKRVAQTFRYAIIQKVPDIMPPKDLSAERSDNQAINPRLKGVSGKNEQVLYLKCVTEAGTVMHLFKRKSPSAEGPITLLTLNPMYMKNTKNISLTRGLSSYFKLTSSSSIGCINPIGLRLGR